MPSSIENVQFILDSLKQNQQDLHDLLKVGVPTMNLVFYNKVISALLAAEDDIQKAAKEYDIQMRAYAFKYGYSEE